MNRPPPLHTPAAVASPEEAARRFVDITAKMALVMAVCDRIHVLDQGRMLAAGTPDEIRGNIDVTLTIV